MWFQLLYLLLAILNRAECSVLFNNRIFSFDTITKFANDLLTLKCSSIQPLNSFIYLIDRYKPTYLIVTNWYGFASVPYDIYIVPLITRTFCKNEFFFANEHFANILQKNEIIFCILQKMITKKQREWHQRGIKKQREWHQRGIKQREWHQRGIKKQREWHQRGIKKQREWHQMGIKQREWHQRGIKQRE